MASAPKKQHKAKPSKAHNLLRSARNKQTGKYARQRARTTANKLRRRMGDTAKRRRIARRREARLAASANDETRLHRLRSRTGRCGPGPQPSVSSCQRELRCPLPSASSALTPRQRRR